MESTVDSESSRILPAYSPAVDTPRYTSEPQPDEERLQINRRHGLVQEASGVYVEKNKHITLALTNQIPNCKEPTYGQGANVRGMLSISKPENVICVEIKLEGGMNLTMVSAVVTNNTNISLFTEKEVLFRRSESFSATEAQSRPRRATVTFPFPRTPPSSTTHAKITRALCPSSLTFSLKFPTTYSHDGVLGPLPPTYSARIDSIPGVHLDARYTLRVMIAMKGSLVDKKILLAVPINFVPRSRPSRPTLPPSLTFLSTLKSSPEEWTLFESKTAVMEGHDGTHVIHSALILPQSQVYPLDNPIPFHIQLFSTSRETLARFSSIAPRSTNSRPFSPSKAWLKPIKPPHASSTVQQSTPGSSQRPLSSQKNSDISRDRTPLDRSSSSVSKRFVRATSPSPVQYSTSGGDFLAKGPNTGKILISIQRHISVAVEGQWIQIKKCISTNTLKQCAIDEPIPNEAAISSLAWDGQIEILEDHRICGGFGGPGVRVRDFVLLSIIPPAAEHSLLQEIHHLIPVRLTTDPYMEEPIGGMELARSQDLP